MARLKLTYPSQNPGTHLIAKTDYKVLQQWLEELPAGNMAKYVVQLSEAITNINRTELPTAQRMKLLELFDTAYEKTHNYYRPLMKSGPFKGKHPPGDELSELHQLTVEISFGYKMCVEQLAGKKTFFRKNKELSYAINLALHYLGLMLLESYEVYSPIPMHTWSEIYQLYLLAEKKDLSEDEHEIDHVRKILNTTEATFLRNCMIAVSNPYHLKRGDHWEVFRYLKHWGPKVVLSEDPEDFRDKNCFVIDLNNDDKPESRRNLKSEDKHDNLRFILTDTVNMNIIHQIDEIVSSGQPPKSAFSKNIDAKTAIHLLKDLLASWEMKQHRQGARYPIISKMEVIWGLKHIHHVLSLMDPLQPGKLQQREADLETAHKSIIESDWSTLNNSKGGICINQPKEKVRDLDVGQLVALRQFVQEDEKVTSQKWQIGVICWITGSKRDGTRVGIQFLNGDIQPVQLRARKGSVLDTRYQPALMLTGETIDGISAPTLLAAPGLHVESRALCMQIGDEIHHIHARTKVSSSLTVDRFFYQQDFQITDEGDMVIDRDETVSSETSEKEEKIDDIIDLSTAPGTYAEDFEIEYEEFKKQQEPEKTLDDIIVKKN